jgi:GNAT superfamily N-acetyltransferase
LTAELSKAARCFLLSVDGAPATFAAVLHRPHPRHAGKIEIYGISRQVTLPDFQGLGLAFALADRLGAAFKAIGKRLHHYPAHPSFIRSFDRSPMWRLEKKSGYSSLNAATSSMGKIGGRPCAVFSYVGPAMDRDVAAKLLGL